MTKCGNLGCKRTDVIHTQVLIMGGAFYADAYFCPEHNDEGLASLRGV